MIRTTAFTCITSFTLTASIATAQSPLGSEFIFQGQLKEGGQPANGIFDVQASLHNVEAGNSLVAGPIVFDGGAGNMEAVTVSNGLFAVELDFGNVFGDEALWLELKVRHHAVGNYVALLPRQPITSAPRSLSTRGLFVDDQKNVGIGTTNPAFPLQVEGQIVTGGPTGGAVSARNPNNQNASLGIGWLNDVARIRIGGSGPGAGGGLDIQRTGDLSLMRILHNGNVGIGTTDPSADLHVVGDGAQTAVRLSNGGSCGGMTNTGLIVGDVCGSGRAASFYGVTSSPLVTITNDGAGRAASFGGDVTINGGDVGIGTSTPEAKLHITGGTDSSLSGGGYLISGNTNGTNISIDNNEIMARNNGAPSTLYLNLEGGDVAFGGAVDLHYQIVTGASSAQCPAGTNVVGGGCRIVGDAEVRGSYPSSNRWNCEAGDQSGFISLTAYAICARVK